MATALPYNPDLECSICFEQFKIPKILPCGHSFCLGCLERYIGGRKGIFQCPFCKQDIKIPRGGVDKFTTNYSLKTLTDSSSPKPTKHYCPIHKKKEVENYCQTCNIGLCSKCFYRDHKDHKYLDLECNSTKEKVVQELTKSEQLIKNKIEDLEKTLEELLDKSEKLKSFCNEACTLIREQTEKIICELKENSVKRQKEICDDFFKNESKLTETRHKIITQMQNIKTDLDTSCPTTTEEPSLTLIYSLNKLQNLQKLCENMKTDIPPVTYVEWREGSVKVCDILGSTVTKPLYQSSEGSGPTVTKQLYQFIMGIGPISTVTKLLYQSIKGDGPISTVTKPLSQSIESNVFRFNYKDIKKMHELTYSEDISTSHGMAWGCSAFNIDRCAYIDIEFLPENNSLVESCRIKYILTILNKDKDKNIFKTTTAWFKPGVCDEDGDHIRILLTDSSEGFI